MWIGFAGLFASVIGLGFSIHHATRPILDRLSETGNQTPEIVRGLLIDALLTPIPIVMGVSSILFLIIFSYSGALFLMRSIALLTKSDAGR